ncbi:MAG TPA: hypothetical protein EYQ69_05025 [Gemmatimonadetes bacterium]|nr:hypothetical protein [Gemmatimonadota bacterium]
MTLHKTRNILLIVVLFCSPNSLSAQRSLNFKIFRETVEPIFLQPRGGHGPSISPCASCHINSGTPLKLQPLQETEDGQAYWSEDQSRQNFEVVSRLVVPGQPERSRLLRKPLSVAAGGAVFHVGGKFWQTQNNPEWQLIATWVGNSDAPADLAALETTPSPLDFNFFQTCVQQIFLNKREGRMECTNCHGSGPRGFAQTIPEDRSYWNFEESRENFEIIKRYVEPGYPLRSRFLTHPLAPEDGGDNYHSGGRRWFSKEDPEWKMLAAWVKGENGRCLSY